MVPVAAMETIAFLGCSSGLGKQTLMNWVASRPEDKVILVSRKQDELEAIASEIQNESFCFATDFSNPNNMDEFLSDLACLNVSRIFYFAGGGPYGLFGDKEWKDHIWALNVNFLAPAKILHQVLSTQNFKTLNQIIFVGSTIADSNPDPKAASYAASKHALKGIVETAIEEYPNKDIRFFRPGYMDTKMLPPNAKVRKTPSQIKDPLEVAIQFVKWSLTPEGERVLTVQ